MEFRRVLFRSLVLNDELVDLEIQLGNELQREVAGDDLGPALTVRCQLFDQASTILVAESLLVEALGQPGYASCVLAVAIDHCDNLGDERVDRKSVVKGQRVSVRVGLGGRRLIKKKQK